MGKNPASIPHREMNNHPQGRSGSGTPMKPGPAKGKVGVRGKNPTSGGGIHRPTKSKMY